MLNFREFITEKEKFREHKFTHNHHHIHDMGDHEIHVNFDRNMPHDNSTHRDLKGNNHWAVSFDRREKSGERTYVRRTKGKSAESRSKSLVAVKRSIDHFITNHKPKSIEMEGNTQRKKQAYAGIASKLARKHGGKRHLLGTDIKTAETIHPAHGFKYNKVIHFKDGTDETSRVIFPHNKNNK